MKKFSWLKQFYCCHFSKPARDRLYYKTAVNYEICRVLEIGISSLDRTCNLLNIIHRFSDHPVEYFGIDLFEAGSQGTSKIGLKTTHVELKKTGAKVKLMPGDPFSCVGRSANLMNEIDLLLIGENVDSYSLAKSWFYLFRMLNDEAPTLIETRDGSGNLVVSEKSYEEIEKVAEQSVSELQSKSNIAA